MRSNHTIQETDYYSLQEQLGYKFKNLKLLLQALTRTSAINSGLCTTSLGDNQRLEFIGDKVLNLTVADILMEQHPNYMEGQLTEKVSHLVRNDGPLLLGMANNLGLGKYLIMDSGEEHHNQGRSNKKILADTIEAVIGAMFLDSKKDYNLIKNIIYSHWQHLTKPTSHNVLFKLVEQLNVIHDEEDKRYDSIFSQIIQAIQNGADIRLKNEQGQTIFHIIVGNVGLVEKILEMQKDWRGIELQGISSDTFEGYEYATDDAYYQPLDFIGINLSKSNLKGVDLSSRTIRNVDFTEADLSNADFRHVKFYNTVFTKANLQNTDFKFCSMDSATRQSYQEAIREGRTPKISIMVDSKEVFDAVYNNNLEKLRLLISDGAQINVMDEGGLIPLHFILDRTPINIINEMGLTPLHIAAGNGYEDMTQFLLENNAKVNIAVQKHNHYNPSDMLSSSFFKSMSQQMTKIGKVPILLKADYTIFGATPLHLAAGNGYKNIAVLLLSYGAETHKEEWKGLTPYALAKSFNHEDTASVFSSCNERATNNSSTTNFQSRTLQPKARACNDVYRF